jgi:hypothetical protein
MSDHASGFAAGTLVLGYDLELRFAEWESLRRAMVRGVSPEFTRDEWAYLVNFVSEYSLRAAFTRTFGPPSLDTPPALFRPRGPLAIWLPNNVSLLGPLVVVLASFTGTAIRVKAGSRSDDLCTAFIRYAINHLRDGALRSHLSEQVCIERFDRLDPRNAAMAADAAVRIAFGSDAAVAGIHGFPHPVESIGISFGDHTSEAWAELPALDDEAVRMLLGVFAIYGQAGCTSPRRVVIIDGATSDCKRLRDRLVASWPTVIRRDVPMHTASQNVLQAQLAAADGWEVRLAPRHAAVFGVGHMGNAGMTGLMSLGIVAGSVEETIATLPANIQTVGTILRDARKLLSRIGQTTVKRFVPVAEMHHFGPVWDGQNFFRQFFEEVPVN